MNEGLRTAVLTPYRSSRTLGGVEIFNESLRTALGELEIFANGLSGRVGPLVDLRRVGLEQPFGALRAARALLRRHHEEPFDVILSNGVCGWPLTLAKPGVPLVQVYHFTMAGLAKHALTLRGDRVTTGHVTALFDRLSGMGKHVVAVSPRVLREVRAFYGLRGRLIPNGVDTGTFRPMDPVSARETLGLPLKAQIGMFVGRPDHTKGFDILLKVARRMSDVHFLVTGAHGGGEANVWPLGPIAHGDMPRWYAASDFFFLPSRYEGFSLALLEALSCNLPAVVSDAACPFPEEFAKCGIVVRGEREQDFEEAIRLILPARPQLSPRVFVQPRYDLKAFGEAWRGFIRAVLDAGG